MGEPGGDTSLLDNYPYIHLTMDEQQQQPLELTVDDARINLLVSADVFARLEQAALRVGFTSIEKYCVYKLVEALDTRIGSAHITGPGQLSGNPTATVTGYKGGIVTRA